MAAPTIANAYCPGRTFAIATTPGRRLEFRGGYARVYDARDMVHVLRRSDVIVEVEARYVDWLPEWMRQAAPPQADVRLPDGIEIGPAPEYELRRPLPPDGAENVPTTPGEEVTVDELLEAGGWSPPKQRRRRGR